MDDDVTQTPVCFVKIKELLGHGGAILQVEVLAPTCYPLPNPGGDWRLSTFFQVPEHLRGRVVQPKELLFLDGEYMDDMDENGDPYDC